LRMSGSRNSSVLHRVTRDGPLASRPLAVMLVSKHAQTKTIYDEKIRGIVTEFLGDVAVGTIGDVAVGTIGDVAVGTIEEPPEPFFDIGDSVVYTGLTQRFNGS
jgi:hypothetical protein